VFGAVPYLNGCAEKNAVGFSFLFDMGLFFIDNL